jgi:Zn-dependent protease with chaperone function
MSKSVNIEQLRRLAKEYSHRLGASWAPRVRITPGAQCSYTPFFHRISIGAELVKHASVDTCKAVLAHEVGHSVQPELRRRAWCLWGALACMIYSCLPLLVLLWTGIEGMTGYFLVMCSLPVIPVVCWLSIVLNESYLKSPLELELEADQYAAVLVGHQRAYEAFVEYSELFCDGMTDKVGQVRLNRLSQPWLNPLPARKVSSDWDVLVF